MAWFPAGSDGATAFLVFDESEATRSHMHPKGYVPNDVRRDFGDPILTGNQLAGTFEACECTPNIVDRSEAGLALTANVAIYASGLCRRELRIASPMAVSSSCPSKGFLNMRW